MRRFLSILLALGLVLSFSLVTAVPAMAQPYVVWVDDDWAGSSPGDPVNGYTFGYDAFATIQDGIDNVDVPGTVNVLDGTYYESIALRDGVDVQGAGIGNSIIDGTGYDHVVTATNISTYTTEFEGFTVTGGDADGSDPDDKGGGMYNVDSDSLQISDCYFYLNSADDWGGGMCNDNSTPDVDNCIFAANSAGNYGGGMYNDNSAPTVTGCQFISNTADDRGGGMAGDYSSSVLINCYFYDNTADFYGGGVYIYNYVTTSFTDCTFDSNTATFLHGGGISSFTQCSPTVTNCVFYNNTAGQNGGGMYNYDYCSPEVTNCTFWGNTAGQNGGGMHNGQYSSPDVTNCTFYVNTADEDGGGICCNNNSDPEITNNIIATNTANAGGGGDTGGGIWANGTSNPDIDYNDVWNNSPDNYSGCSPDTGNISANPQFVNPALGDFHLQSGSLCIDAGDNSAPALPSFDFEGDPRIWDGDGDLTADVDMGIDEYYVAPPIADTDADTYHTDQSVTASGSGFLPGVPVDFYVVDDFAWSGGESIPPSGPTYASGTFFTDGSGDFDNELIWAATLLQGDYDVVFDTNGNGDYDFAVDAVDDAVVGTGFTVLNYAPNDPTNLGPPAYVDGSWGTDDTPTLQFDQSDDDVNDQVQYRIQIDNTAGFVSPEVDFTSALMAQGTAYYTPATALTEDEYYWRVMTYDEWGDNSNWVEANGGNVAFRLDTTPATGAGTSNDAGTLKDEFLSNEDVWVTGNGFTPDTNGQVDVYVLDDRAWSDLDVIANYAPIFMVTINTTGGTIDPDPSLLWPAPLDVGEYDVVFDVDQDGVYNVIPDFVDDPNHPGFVVIPPGRVVGGEVFPIDKMALLMPWLGLALALILATGSLILVRRQAHK